MHFGTPRAKSQCHCQAVFVCACIAFLNLALRAVDLYLGILLSVMTRVLNVIDFCFNSASFFWQLCCCCSERKNEANKHAGSRVCIIGASFGGIATLKGLASKPNVDITIIDSRDYFEYTPGILRAFVQPDHIHKLTADLKRLEELGHNVTFLHAEVKSIHDGELLVRSCKVKSDT